MPYTSRYRHIRDAPSRGRRADDAATADWSQPRHIVSVVVEHPPVDVVVQPDIGVRLELAQRDDPTVRRHRTEQQRRWRAGIAAAGWEAGGPDVRRVLAAPLPPSGTVSKMSTADVQQS